MSTQRYSVAPHPIETLLTWVKSGEIAIPEIQRPFVWDAIKVRNLLDSLYEGYPVERRSSRQRGPRWPKSRSPARGESCGYSAGTAPALPGLRPKAALRTRLRASRDESWLVLVDAQECR